MGYRTQNLIAMSNEFQMRVELAVVKLAENALGGANDVMAKSVARQSRGAALSLVRPLALAGLDLDSTDAEIDTAVLARIDWIKASLGVA